MQLIINHCTGPAFNLALEEYILTKKSGGFIILWRNEASVIVGRNQNAIEEIDMGFTKNHDVKVVRRLSGGGAVFHDLGNINYSVITEFKGTGFGDFGKFAAPVCEFLNGLGVDAYLEGRNDLLIGGAKFSGNAQAVKNGRILHHGTILFDADISWLAAALKPGAAKIESKGVKSVRSRVTNVTSHLPGPMGVDEFFEQLSGFFLDKACGLYRLSDSDVSEAQLLVAEKYGTWGWNFGTSPAYSYQHSERFPFGTVDLRLSVEGGFIKAVHIFGDFFGKLEVEGLEGKLLGLAHNGHDIAEALNNVDISSYIQGITNGQFFSLFKK
ncbi:MAG: lipoate--protein ligase [Clostridiales bacterium]|jgi:lipoate-protein ligase A|nr:lipoate--protein ligase [Clostridiales bacterium]